MPKGKIFLNTHEEFFSYTANIVKVSCTYVNSAVCPVGPTELFFLSQGYPVSVLRVFSFGGHTTHSRGCATAGLSDKELCRAVR